MTAILTAIRDPRYSRSFEPKCPVENVSTMEPSPSGPAGLRWKCGQCGVVVVMPRAPLARALQRVTRK
jgi:hypothetical protein